MEHPGVTFDLGPARIVSTTTFEMIYFSHPNLYGFLQLIFFPTFNNFLLAGLCHIWYVFILVLGIFLPDDLR